MEKLLGLGVLVQIVACAVVGVRLLRLAARTREVPELALGSAFLLLGALGQPLALVARSGALAAEPTALLLAVALAAQDAACLGIYVMTWRTFRADRRAPVGAVALAALGFGASIAVAAQDVASVDAGPGYWLGYGLRFGAFLWTAAESLRQHAMLRRRLRLGLADPVVCDRFRLWSISNVAVCVGFAIFGATRLAQGGTATSPLLLIASSAVAVVAGAGAWLAFLPPARYTRWVAARS